MKYRPEIDGLRAIAVLPVILFHAGFNAFSGGFVGVDVFFVISGYLITSIIHSELQSGSFSIVNFYERRARRILPALFLVMGACVPAAYIWLLPPDLKSFAGSLAAVSVFGSNILFWRESGYFDTDAELKPLLHTWSLAVEEQYYVLFPLFLMLTWRLGTKRVIGLLVILGAISLAVAHWGAFNKPSATFFLLPTRGWELLIGALIALRLAETGAGEQRNGLAQSLSILGILAIAWSVAAYSKDTPFPSLYALIPTIGTGLVILFATPATWVGQLLGSRLPVAIGMVSYSAYLWHQPLFAFARQRDMTEPSTVALLMLSALALALAYLSWRYIESPFRQKGVFSRKQVFIFAVAGSVAFASIGLAIRILNGFEAEHYRSLDARDRQIYDSIKRHTGGNMYPDMQSSGCNIWVRRIDVATEQRFHDCARQYGKAVIVLGDSHAMNLYNSFYWGRVAPFVLGVSQGGCRPHDNFSYCHYDSFDEFLVRNRQSVEVVLYHQAGFHLLRDERGNIPRPAVFEDDTALDVNQENIAKVATYLNRLARVSKVVWLGPFVEARVNFRDYRRFRAGYYINEKSIDVFARLDEFLRGAYGGSRQSFQYVSFSHVVRIDSQFLRIGDCITYRNEDHFSVCGERLVGRHLARAVRQWRARGWDLQ